MATRTRRKQLSSAEMSQLNQEAFESQPDYDSDPRFREVTSAEAAERRDRKKQLPEELDYVTSLTGKAAVLLAAADDIEAIKAKYTPHDAIELDEIDERISDADVPETSIGQGVVWDPYSHDLSKQVQRDIGYGPPHTPPEE